MATLGYNDLRKGVVFDIDGAPYEVIEYAFVRMQQRKAVAQVKMKNLINGKVISRNFHQSEQFEAAEMERFPIKFLYANRGEFWFSEKNDPSKRFSLAEDVVGAQGLFIKPNSEVTAISFNDKIVNVELPIKVDLVDWSEIEENFRAIILLADVQEFAYKEIAEMLSIPIGTVMSRLSRGRKLLRQELGDYAVAARRYAAPAFAQACAV